MTALSVRFYPLVVMIGLPERLGAGAPDLARVLEDAGIAATL